MPEPVLRGTSEPQQNNLERHYDPESGWRVVTEFTGISPEKVALWEALFQSTGCATSFSVRNGIGRLSVNDTTGQVAIDKWEVDAEQVSLSSLLNPLNINSIGGDDPKVSADNLDIFLKFARNDISYEDAKAQLADDDYSSRLLIRIASGSTDFQADKYILRHTTNVSNRLESNVSDANVERIYTTAQLLTETQNPFAWVFPLPGRLAYKINALSTNAITNYGVADNYLWGWLKSASTERSAANQRVDICTLYKFDCWSTDEYLTVTGGFQGGYITP